MQLKSGLMQLDLVFTVESSSGSNTKGGIQAMPLDESSNVSHFWAPTLRKHSPVSWVDGVDWTWLVRSRSGAETICWKTHLLRFWIIKHVRGVGTQTRAFQRPHAWWVIRLWTAELSLKWILHNSKQGEEGTFLSAGPWRDNSQDELWIIEKCAHFVLYSCLVQ